MLEFGEQITHQAMPDVDCPGEDFIFRESEDFRIQESHLAREDIEDVCLAGAPIFAAGLKSFNGKQLAERPVQ